MCAALALFILLAGVIWPTAAGAQDIIGPETRRAETVSGPYTVIADAQPLPSLQSAQFFIQVYDTASGAPVDDVRVTILTIWSGGDQIGENIALSPKVPGLYTATLKFKPGRWETTLLIEPPDGGSYGADGFVFAVPEPSSNVGAGFVFLAVAVVLAAGAAYLVWQARQNTRRRQAAANRSADNP